MVKASNKGNVNVYMVFANYRGEITDECLIATFINERFALEFLRKANETGNYNEYNYLDMRTV